MLPTGDVLSIIAIVISVASFSVAFYSAFQDRPRLKIRSQYFDASEWGPSHFTITLVHKGRRPIILNLLGGADAAGNYGGTYFDHDKGGRRLGEHERYEQTVDYEGTIQLNPEGDDLLFSKMWVEDSLGNRHPIPNSESFIKRLRAAGKEVG